MLTIFAIPNGKNGVIAQLVEQRTENPCVPGSIPGDTTSEKESYRNVTLFFFLKSSDFVIFEKLNALGYADRRNIGETEGIQG